MHLLWMWKVTDIRYSWTISSNKFGKNMKKIKIITNLQKKVKSWIEFKKVVKKYKKYKFSKPVARNEIQFGHSLRGSPTSMPIRES